MRAALRIAVKDVAEVSCSSRAVLLIFLCPCLFVIMIGHLRAQPITVRLLLSGAEADKILLDTARDALSEIESLQVNVAAASDDTRAELERGAFDLLATRQPRRWTFSTAVTDPFLFGMVQQILPRLRAVLQATEDELSGREQARKALENANSHLVALRSALAPPSKEATVVVTPQLLNDVESKVDLITAELQNATLSSSDSGILFERLGQVRDVVTDIRTAPVTSGAMTPFLGTLTDRVVQLQQRLAEVAVTLREEHVPSLSLLSAAAPADRGDFIAYYPRAGERPRALLPQAVALVCSVLAFVLACTTLVREREERTLEVLLSLPAVGPGSLLAGKCLGAVALTTACFLLLLGVLHAMFGIYIKDGLVQMLAAVAVPGAITASLQGLIVSTVVTSTLQSTVAAVLFLLVQSLVGGFLYPVSTQSPGFFGALSRVVPLTYWSPALESWALGRSPAWLESFVPLLALAVFYAIGARLAWCRLHQRL